MAIKHKQNRLSIVLSPSTTPSPEKPPHKRCSFPATPPKSYHPPTAHQSNPQDQILVDQLKTDGSRQTEQIKQHLNLIHSFNLLIQLSQQTILSLNLKSKHHPPSEHQQHQLEDTFYHLVLFRFELWLGRIADHLPKSLFHSNHHSKSHSSDVVLLKNLEDDYQIELTADYLPPLDVLFVWYCYCFNSRNYYEDSLRLYPILKHMRFPLELAASEYDCSCTSTNCEKLRTKTKIADPEEVEALLRNIKLASLAETSIQTSDNHSLPELKHPSLLSNLLFPKNFHSSKTGSHSQKLWVTLTNTNFNLIDFINQPSFRTFTCPLCSYIIESPFYVRNPQDNLVQVTEECWSYASDASLLSAASQDERLEQVHQVRDETPRMIVEKNNSHLAHKNQAKLSCLNCSWSGVKQHLSLFKFATELKFCLDNNLASKNNGNSGSNHSDSAPIDCLAGTLTTSENLNDVQNAAFFNNLFLQDEDHAIFKHFNERNPSDLYLDCLNYLKRVQTSINVTTVNDKTSVSFCQKNSLEKSFNNLLKSYSVPEPFSVDLIRSMKIQRQFIKRMVKLGWTEINGQKNRSVTIPPEEIDRRLQSCVSRYKAFSSLIATTQPHLILIPTSDIDLAWKTDRLRGVLYTESIMGSNKIMIDHPDEFDFDKSKFLDQFRLTSALWIHRYHIDYSRYPAPFVKSDRRQNWLKKVMTHVPSFDDSTSGGEHPNQVDSDQEKDLVQMKLTQSQIQNILPTEMMHSKLAAQAAPEFRSGLTSSAVAENSSPKKPLGEPNHQVNVPIKPVNNLLDGEASRGMASPTEFGMDPVTTPLNQLFEHNSAQISVANYFENIYTADDSFEIKKQNQLSQKGKQVSTAVVESNSSSTETLCSSSVCPTSLPMVENEVGSDNASEATNLDAGIIYEARRISITPAEGTKDPNHPITKIYLLTERYDGKTKSDALNHRTPPKILSYTTVSPIKVVPLDSSISRHQNSQQHLTQQPFTRENNQRQRQIGGTLNSKHSILHRSDTNNRNSLKSVEGVTQSVMANHQVKPHVEDNEINSLVYHRLHLREESKPQQINFISNQLNDQKKTEASALEDSYRLPSKDAPKSQKIEPILKKLNDHQKKVETAVSEDECRLRHPDEQKPKEIEPTLKSCNEQKKIGIPTSSESHPLRHQDEPEPRKMEPNLKRLNEQKRKVNSPVPEHDYSLPHNREPKPTGMKPILKRLNEEKEIKPSVSFLQDDTANRIEKPDPTEIPEKNLHILRVPAARNKYEQHVKKAIHHSDHHSSTHDRIPPPDKPKSCLEIPIGKIAFVEGDRLRYL